MCVSLSAVQLFKTIIRSSYTFLLALRLYPQLPVNVRVVAKTTLIPSGGDLDGKSPVLIPRGTRVGYSVYHMHRLNSWYGEDANSFRPERWLGPELESIGWGFIPFHGGPRICLGSKWPLLSKRYTPRSSWRNTQRISHWQKLRMPWCGSSRHSLSSDCHLEHLLSLLARRSKRSQ